MLSNFWFLSNILQQRDLSQGSSKGPFKKNPINGFVCISGKPADRNMKYSIAIQELQSPNGPRHSDAILTVSTGDSSTDIDKSIGIVWFSNDIVKPRPGSLTGGAPLGEQTGHCVQVDFREEAGKLACYFNFNVVGEKTGRITAEALFDLSNFPAADLVITGGSDDFAGIVGSGCTSLVPDFDFEGSTFIYNFWYSLK